MFASDVRPSEVRVLASVMMVASCGGAASMPPPEPRAINAPAPAHAADAGPTRDAAAVDVIEPPPARDAGPEAVSAVGDAATDAATDTAWTGQASSIACAVARTFCFGESDCKPAGPSCAAHCKRRPWMPVAGRPDAKRPPGICVGHAAPQCDERPYGVDAQGHKFYRPECL